MSTWIRWVCSEFLQHVICTLMYLVWPWCLNVHVHLDWQRWDRSLCTHTWGLCCSNTCLLWSACVGTVLLKSCVFATGGLFSRPRREGGGRAELPQQQAEDSDCLLWQLDKPGLSRAPDPVWTTSTQDLIHSADQPSLPTWLFIMVHNICLYSVLLFYISNKMFFSLFLCNVLVHFSLRLVDDKDINY